MNADVINVFEDLIAVEIAKLDKVTRSDLDKTISMLAGKGILMGSAALSSVRDVLASTIPTRAQVALNLIVRSLAAHGIAIESSNKSQVQELLSGWIERQVISLQQLAKDTAPYKSKSGEQYAAAFLAVIDETAQLEIKRIGGELTLIAASNSTQKRDATGNHPSLVFNAAVGMVQTGPGSFGVAIQHMDSQSSDALNKALEKILELLDENPDDKSIDIASTKEIVIESKTEIAKDKPNIQKVKALINAVGSSIAYAPKLKDGYDTLKWAAAFLGINLP